MSPPREPKPFQRRLLAVEPWKASGPGWANGGYRAYFEETHFRGSIAETKIVTEYLYEKDMTAEEALGFSIAIRALEPARRRFEKKEVGPHVRWPSIRVGSRVRGAREGPGTVVSIDGEGSFPIMVRFDDWRWGTRAHSSRTLEVVDDG